MREALEKNSWRKIPQKQREKKPAAFPPIRQKEKRKKQEQNQLLLAYCPFSLSGSIVNV